MKILLLITVLLTGCSTQQILCTGTGTCGLTGTVYATPQQPGQFTPQTVWVNGQQIIIIPQYSSQRTQSILIPGK